MSKVTNWIKEKLNKNARMGINQIKPWKKKINIYGTIRTTNRTEILAETYQKKKRQKY